MDETRYLPNYGATQGYRLSQRPKDNYINDDDDEVEEDEEQQEGDAVDSDINGAIQQNRDDVDNDDDDTDEEAENHTRNDTFRHPKKRKLKSLSSSFEFSPRIPPPLTSTSTLKQTPVASSTAKPSFGGRNTLTDWTEHETFVLLEAWGERFVKRGRKSLRSEEWQEVAEKVSNDSKIERTDTQCRNRLDTLKKKYKKEKLILTSKWVYFKKMDMLMSSTPQQGGLSCGVDSGEFVFMNPTVYLDRANGLDEMRDSPGNSDSGQEGNDDSGRLKVKGGSFKLLADSINKFSEIYEKIENGKRKQMVELEKMRMDFYKELELQKREILDRAREEIVRIRQGENEENISG